MRDGQREREAWTLEKNEEEERRRGLDKGEVAPFVVAEIVPLGNIPDEAKQNLDTLTKESQKRV